MRRPEDDKDPLSATLCFDLSIRKNMSIVTPVQRPSWLDPFLGYCHLHTYPAKKDLMKPDDPADTLLYVVDGQLTVLLEDEDGKEIILTYLNKGDFIGEMGLFAPQPRRSVIIRTRATCELAEITYKKLEQLLNSALLFMSLGDQQETLVMAFWSVISVFLLVDLFIRIRHWHRRGQMFSSSYTWMTFLGSLPIPFIPIVRIVINTYILRKLRRGEIEELGRVIVARHAQSTVFIVIFLAIIIFEFGSILIIE